MLKTDDLKAYNRKNIVSIKDAESIVQKLRGSGKNVGLCHGGFDLLHPGHVLHFEAAKRLCDVLIVSVTSDRYVTSRKGTGRPIFTDRLRAYMIASLGCVDYVVISDFKLGADVIGLLKPSFYIKGPDFVGKNTPGINSERDAIRSVGGEMKYTTEPNLSTTDIIDYIKNEVDRKRLLLVIDRDGTLVLDQGFLGQNKSWKQDVVYNDDVISLISYLQTRYNTTKIVVTNQAAVARKLFSEQRVKEVNSYIDAELCRRGIRIDNWQFCPDVDSEYAEKMAEIDFDKRHVKKKTKRKPSPEMVHDGLKEVGAKPGDFDQIIVLGDRPEDEGLARNLKAKFIDVKDRDYEELLKELKS